MSTVDKSGLGSPSDEVSGDTVWPPEIEYHIVDNADNPVMLTKAQLDRVRYLWFHVLAVPLLLGAGAEEYFSTSPGLWQTSFYKISILCLCLLGFVGNLWRAYQGWQIKAVLDSHRHE